jgi:hypothetical protein
MSSLMRTSRVGVSTRNTSQHPVLWAATEPAVSQLLRLAHPNMSSPVDAGRTGPKVFLRGLLSGPTRFSVDSTPDEGSHLSGSTSNPSHHASAALTDLFSAHDLDAVQAAPPTGSAQLAFSNPGNETLPSANGE